mmetsp:Transcript_10839/g.20307  ORF Transcript_10839/g.20307 Transcript_10839/m.20307 type:complete len:103 (-) Transcript_10839:116-424(-)
MSRIFWQQADGNTKVMGLFRWSSSFMQMEEKQASKDSALLCEKTESAPIRSDASTLTPSSSSQDVPSLADLQASYEVAGIEDLQTRSEPGPVPEYPEELMGA